ncbi:MAG: hypothetical protein Salg2KO_20750 [Salibacteraceae bacterium]
MIETPLILEIGFGLLTAITIAGIFRATKSTFILNAFITIAIYSALLADYGFFNQPEAFPPRLPFVVLPALILIVWLFLTKKGGRILDQMDMKAMTYVHTVRVPVELTIFALFTYGLMPESMTFEGRNWDVLSGLTAPFIAYFGYQQKRLPKWVLVSWNALCLALVLQVVLTGVLAAPSVMQQLDFDQPNVAVLLFPYVWLPAIVVPVVVIGHLAALRRFYKSTNPHK